MIEINLKPHSFACHDFTLPSGEKLIVTAIIVPLKTVIKNAENENKTLLYSWSCNYVESCENPYCIYSKKLKRT